MDSLLKVSGELKTHYNPDILTDLPSSLDQSKILIFDSNFESGNLGKVNICSLNEYNLFLKPDTNTQGNTQWFYFAVSNTSKGQIATFNILNCSKSSTLFDKGMRPLVFSEKEYKSNKVEWTPDTFNIQYLRNNIVRNPSRRGNYLTLTFSYEFKHTGDKVYFAYSRPYTLSMHFFLLNSIKQKLLNNANHVSLLDDNKLYNTIKEYAQNSLNIKPNSEQSDDENIVAISEEISKLYKYSWLKSNDVEIKSQGMIYRQETLCRSYCGIPITLITITNQK